MLKDAGEPPINTSKSLKERGIRHVEPYAGAVGVFVASIPITYFLQRLNYEMRWYIVTDRSLRIRSGVVWLREMTMTFANIQGIRVSANPIEGLLGLADVEVQSAGGGDSQGRGAPASGHVAKFEG